MGPGQWLEASLVLAMLVATAGDAFAQAEAPPSPSVDCQAPAPPPRPVAPLVRDARHVRAQPRPAGLVANETEGLEGLLAHAAAGAMDRPLILRRLAEDYVELESRAAQEQAPTVAHAWRQKAIRMYTTLRDEVPAYAALDEVLYYLGYAYELDGDPANARRVQYTLIQSRPSSRYIPLAYLSFAELFFNEGAQDPSKWTIAEQAYEKVVSFPPPDNHAYGYAWFKLAHVYWRHGQAAKARAAFQKARSWGQAYPQEPAALSVSQAAGSDLARLQAVCPP